MGWSGWYVILKNKSLMQPQLVELLRDCYYGWLLGDG